VLKVNRPAVNWPCNVKVLKTKRVGKQQKHKSPLARLYSGPPLGFSLKQKLVKLDSVPLKHAKNHSNA
jgi:hypothetical protein